MGVDAEVLLLGPFKEVVERGKEALANAEDAGEENAELSRLMLKAAQGVVKEGERALKRLQPLWDGQIEKYGDAFRDGLGQNEDVEDKRRRLEDLLYDFEDYTEADTFEADRFTDLQAATKALALNVIDLIKKMKLDAPESPLPYSPPASSKFPPLPPLPPSAATRSASVSSSVPGTSGLRNARPRRPPTPVGNRDRSRSPPPSLPHKSPERPGTAQQQWGGSSLSLSSSMTAPPDAMPQPLRVVPPGPRRNVNLNTNSHRSVTSSGTSRSRMSQVSAGSLESMPPPAYTAAGEAVVTGPSSVPQDELPRTATSRASTPEQLPEPPREHSRVSPLSPAEPEPEATTTAPAVSYGIFPTPRPNHASHGTRINAWVSDQAEPASRLPASPSPSLPQPQPQLQPHPPNLLHRPGSRYEPHSLQALQSLQSLTIPEDKAVGVVRPKHASVIDFSPLTPMLSQLQQLGQFSGSSAASSPSGETTTSTERLRMSPLSQGTSVSSSFQVKAEQQPSPPPPHQSHPLQTPDQTVATGMNPFRPNPSLTPLSLPAAAMEETLRSLPPTSPVQSPTQSQIPSALPEEWLQQRDHYHHRHQPPTVLSSDRASTTTGLISSSSSSHHSLPTSLTHPQPGPPPREPDTAIGPRSSLYALSGGFCPGARLFRASSHQDGVRRLAGHVAGVSTAAARCASCPYGHAFAELDLDVNDKSPRASFPRAGGVVFRMRLLYKSHLAPPSSSSAAARPSEALYGCLFCARDGATPREGDATVFRTADALLRHLARHPRPLAPAGADGVDGVTVLYGREVLATDPRVNDFDLWLDAWGDEDPRRQLADLDVRVPPPAAADGVSLPFATAVRSHVQRYAEKKLARPEGKGADALLQFFVGARIVGVEFPRAFGGKWCTGWHDGEWGYFPPKAIELEKPPPGRLDAPPPPPQQQFLPPHAPVSVTARWRWDADGGREGWLGFDKGERITGVGWPVLGPGATGGREAWCWSGTNARGRFGVFPRSHVDEATLRDDVVAATAGGGGAGRRKKEGGGKGSSGKSLFGARRRASTASSRSGGGIAEII